MAIGPAAGVLRRLIEEEERHIKLINRILKGLREGPKLEVTDIKKVVLKRTNYFDKRAISEFTRQIMEGPMMSDISIFNTAWLIEKDLSEFYNRMAEQTGGEARKALYILS